MTADSGTPSEVVEVAGVSTLTLLDHALANVVSACTLALNLVQRLRDESAVMAARQRVQDEAIGQAESQLAGRSRLTADRLVRDRKVFNSQPEVTHEREAG